MWSVEKILRSASGDSRQPASFGGLRPLLLAAMEQRVAIFGKNPALLHQIVDCILVARQIIFAICVAFGNRLSRIARLLTFCGSLWKRNIRRLKRNPLIGRANGWVA